MTVTLPRLDPSPKIIYNRLGFIPAFHSAKLQIPVFQENFI